MYYKNDIHCAGIDDGTSGRLCSLVVFGVTRATAGTSFTAVPEIKLKQ